MIAVLRRLQPFTGFALFTPLCMLGAPVAAQDQAGDARSPDPPINQPDGMEQLGRTSETAAGQVGQRKTVTGTPLNSEPLARINSRIQNRIESRLDNRIDRNYDPEERATSAFELAGSRARQASRVDPR